MYPLPKSKDVEKWFTEKVQKKTPDIEKHLSASIKNTDWHVVRTSDDRYFIITDREDYNKFTQEKGPFAGKAVEFGIASRTAIKTNASVQHCVNVCTDAYR